MSQFSFLGLPARLWSVGDLVRYLRQMIESDYRVQDVWVRGELSNLSRPGSGHLYFTLKDANASLRCVMWRSEVIRQRHLAREGETVEVHGRLSVYEAAGQVQLYADALQPTGEGELFQAFLRLKERLEAEGLFASERKRSLPGWPRRIGVVTSPAAAALRDVVHVLRRRYPLVQVVVAPTPVQGIEAPMGIAAALAALNRRTQPDVILLVRGGGSLEDLAAFNSEEVARAIAASAAPVVTGVGHETDFTIADFVADVRAPTPSAAAELATPDRIEVGHRLARARRELQRVLAAVVEERRRALLAARGRLASVSPQAQLASAFQRMDELELRLRRAVESGLELRRTRRQGLTMTLQAVNPLAVLARGYAVVLHRGSGAVVRSVSQVRSGDEIQVRVHDGAFSAVAGKE